MHNMMTMHNHDFFICMVFWKFKRDNMHSCNPVHILGPWTSVYFFASSLYNMHALCWVNTSMCTCFEMSYTLKCMAAISCTPVALNFKYVVGQKEHLVEKNGGSLIYSLDSLIDLFTFLYRLAWIVFGVDLCEGTYYCCTNLL